MIGSVEHKRSPTDAFVLYNVMLSDGSQTYSLPDRPPMPHIPVTYRCDVLGCHSLHLCFNVLTADAWQIMCLPSAVPSFRWLHSVLAAPPLKIRAASGTLQTSAFPGEPFGNAAVQIAATPGVSQGRRYQNHLGVGSEL